MTVVAAVSKHSSAPQVPVSLRSEDRRSRNPCSNGPAFPRAPERIWGRLLCIARVSCTPPQSRPNHGTDQADGDGRLAPQQALQRREHGRHHVGQIPLKADREGRWEACSCFRRGSLPFALELRAEVLASLNFLHNIRVLRASIRRKRVSRFDSHGLIAANLCRDLLGECEAVPVVEKHFVVVHPHLPDTADHVHAWNKG